MSLRASAVTIGSFDGVHLGHRRLLAELAHVAGRRGLAAVVVTFDRHPASVVRPGSAPLLLTDLPQRIELLRAAGADDVRVLPFDEARAAEQAADFVREVLADDLAARVVIVGRDFHFGHGRAGNVGLLRDMGGELGFEVIAYDLVPDPDAGAVVSSTRIRALLARGDVEAAADLLGRPHELRGELLPAAPPANPPDGRGNAYLVVPPGIAVPAAGGYRVELVSDEPGAPPGRGLDALASVGGPNEGGERLVEVQAPRAGPSLSALVGARGRVRFLAPVSPGVRAEPDGRGIRARD